MQVWDCQDPSCPTSSQFSYSSTTLVYHISPNGLILRAESRIPVIFHLPFGSNNPRLRQAYLHDSAPSSYPTPGTPSPVILPPPPYPTPVLHQGQVSQQDRSDRAPLSPEHERLVSHESRTQIRMAPNTENQDARVARNCNEAEEMLRHAEDLRAAHRLAESLSIQHQEIAVEEGQRNIEDRGRIAGAWADANASPPPSPTSQPANELPAKTERKDLKAATIASSMPTPDQKCCICASNMHLRELPNLGVLCFSCMHQNMGVELERLVYG